MATEELDLLANEEPVTHEVDVLDPQSEHFTLPGPTPGGHDRSCPPSLRMSLDHGHHLLDRPRDNLGWLNRRGLSPHWIGRGSVR